MTGSILASMLDVDTFLLKNGPKWMLADGSKAPENSDYFKLFPNSTVPDLRGVFLRGKNYNRDPAIGNADGDFKTGEFQPFSINSHSHGYTQMVYDNSIDGVDSTARYSGEHHNELRQTEAIGGKEVRPNNVTVNFFICVN